MDDTNLLGWYMPAAASLFDLQLRSLMHIDCPDGLRSMLELFISIMVFDMMRGCWPLLAQAY